MTAVQGLLSTISKDLPVFNVPANRLDAPDTSRLPLLSAGNGDSVSLSQSAVLQQYSREYRNQQSVSLDLITREGDRVTVELSSVFEEGLTALKGSAAAQDANGRSALRFSSFERSVSLREQLYFSVEGDLNDEELAAIESLLIEVDDLLQDFFAGDIDQALQEALAIELDGTEIAAISLDANQSTLSREIQTYRAVQQFSSEQPSRSATSGVADNVMSIEQLLALLEAKTRELLEKFESEAGLALDKPALESAQTLLTPLLELQ